MAVRVLIVEDEEQIARFTELELKHEGYEVAKAADGRTGLSMAEEGGYWAEVPDLPGCVTEADTLDELKEMLKDAITGYLEVASENAQPIGSSLMMQVAV